MIAVRYFSKLGNTKTIAEAIAEGAGVKAVSITEEPELTEPVDVLVLGGGSYANFLAPELLANAGKKVLQAGTSLRVISPTLRYRRSRCRLAWTSKI